MPKGRRAGRLHLETFQVTTSSLTQAQLAPYQYVFSRAFQPLFKPARYKVFWGGRGGAKSWSVARALINIAHTGVFNGVRVLGGVRVGCFRELQNSIKDSVHRLLVDQIEAMGLLPWFDITQNAIVSRVTGSEFIFKGLRSNATEIKSMEGIHIAWVEEAQLVSEISWQLLIPTIRQDIELVDTSIEQHSIWANVPLVNGTTMKSEIWITFNPVEETDATYKRFITNRPKPGEPEYNDYVIVKVNWDSNPWFPATLESERQHMLKKDPEAYEHVWGGECRVIGDAVIFKGKYVLEVWDTPVDPAPRFFHGADFGFAEDPATLLRCYTTGEPPNEELWIDREAFGFKTEIDALPLLYDKIETSRLWPIKADNARPECISYVRRQNFNISAAEKWQGCVEDRIAHLKGFKKIHIHANFCPHIAREARLYSYKVDRVSGDILPIVVDKHNHGWDAVGYALDGYIQRRGADKIWAKLAR